MLRIVAQVLNFFAPEEGVLVTANLAFPGGGNEASALLQPASGRTDATGKVIFFITTLDVTGDVDDYPYVATFSIGNGTDPLSKQTVTGNII